MQTPSLLRVWTLALALGACVAGADDAPTRAFEYVWLLPGSELLAAPELDARPVARVDELAFLPIYERNGPFLYVAYRGRLAWVSLDVAYVGLRRDPAASFRVPQPDALEAAWPRRFFPRQESQLLGPFRLFTDSQDAALLAFLADLAWQVEPAYRARFGVAVEGPATAETVLLFATEDGYRTFLAARPKLLANDVGGAAGRATAVLLVGARSRWEVASSLVHQLTHVLTRRRVREPLPAFLEEGLAEDLDRIWMEDSQAPAPGLFGQRWGQADYAIPSGFIDLVRLATSKAATTWPTMAGLMAMDGTSFFQSSAYPANRSASSWLVRYLLEGEGGSLRPRFQAFLAEVVQGKPATAALLLEHLDQDASALDAALPTFAVETAHQAALYVTPSHLWDGEPKPWAPLPANTGVLSASRAPAAPKKSAYDYLWLLPATPLRAAASADAASAGGVRRISYLPILSQKEGWYEVQYLGKPAWVEEEAALRLRERDPKPGLRWVSPAPDPEEVGLAKRIFGHKEPSGTLGSFKFFTDSEDAALLEFLDHAARQAEAAYEARFGIDITTRATESIILFGREDSFRKFTATKPRLLISDPVGLAGRGTALLFAGDRPRWEVASTLIHELAHTLNRRRFNEPPPPWLEEGLAEDLGCIWAEDPLAPAPGMMGTRWQDPKWRMAGSCYTELLAMHQQPERFRFRSLEDLVAIDRKNFYGIDSRMGYLQGTLAVAYFLDGEDGALAAGFRAFLKDVAEEKLPTAKLLQKHLGRSWEELNRGFLRFVEAEIARYVPLFSPSEEWMPRP